MGKHQRFFAATVRRAAPRASRERSQFCARDTRDPAPIDKPTALDADQAKTSVVPTIITHTTLGVLGWPGATGVLDTTAAESAQTIDTTNRSGRARSPIHRKRTPVPSP